MHTIAEQWLSDTRGFLHPRPFWQSHAVQGQTWRLLATAPPHACLARGHAQEVSSGSRVSVIHVHVSIAVTVAGVDDVDGGSVAVAVAAVAELAAAAAAAAAVVVLEREVVVSIARCCSLRDSMRIHGAGSAWTED